MCRRADVPPLASTDDQRFHGTRRVRNRETRERSWDLHLSWLFLFVKSFFPCPSSFATATSSSVFLRPPGYNVRGSGAVSMMLWCMIWSRKAAFVETEKTLRLGRLSGSRLGLAPATRGPDRPTEGRKWRISDT